MRTYDKHVGVGLVWAANSFIVSASVRSLCQLFDEFVFAGNMGNKTKSVRDSLREK